MKTLKTIAFAFALLSLPAVVNAQIIENLENERGGSSSSDGGVDTDLLWLDLLLNIGIEPFWGLMFGFPNEAYVNEVDFSYFPYDDGYSGSYLPIEEEGKKFQGQFITHFQNNENTLSGGYFQLKLSPTRFLTLDVNHLQLFENRIDKEGKDYLGITNFNLHYNRIRKPKAQFWWGSGLMLFNSNEVLYGSPTFTTGTTLFIKQPVSIHLEVQMGAPNEVFTALTQARLQAHWSRYLFYGGFSGIKRGSIFEGSWSIGTGLYF